MVAACHLSRHDSCVTTTSNLIHQPAMATLVPPKSAKRARLEREADERRVQALAESGHMGPSSKTLVVQFRHGGEDGAPLGPVISLPAATGAREMNAIVNQLRRQMRKEQREQRTREEREAADSDEDEEEDEDLPFSFHVSLDDAGGHVNDKDGKAVHATRLTVAKSLRDDVLESKEATRMGLSEEDTLHVVFEPQAVFRVRPVRRCSSTLTGKYGNTWRAGV